MLYSTWRFNLYNFSIYKSILKYFACAYSKDIETFVILENNNHIIIFYIYHKLHVYVCNKKKTAMNQNDLKIIL